MINKIHKDLSKKCMPGQANVKVDPTCSTPQFELALGRTLVLMIGSYHHHLNYDTILKDFAPLCDEDVFKG